MGNSLGVLIPKQIIDNWGVSVGDMLNVSEEGIVPPPKKNPHLSLDDLKLAISMEAVSRFSLEAIRKKSRDNLARWKKQGTWGPVYAEWRDILKQGDAELVRAMIGRDDQSNRLRQSMPYVGLLPRNVVEALREKI